MKSREEALSYGLSFEDTYIDAPFHDNNWQLVRFNGNKKAFLWTYERDGYINLNVKVSPDVKDFWRNIYKSVKPGYHQNKEHWNTIVLDGTIPIEDIKRMIAESYDLSHRVVNAKGMLAKEFAFGGEFAQAKLLEAEGVEVIKGRVDLSKYLMEEI